ncbi:unnamed protein product, partial [Schistocephalus solidus]|uniref:V-SNARE coiled-coil homology domain-containing protein n=1 Tax=Schistocephalus solidus TaxID=70667 RepID=A0A183SPW9_SCHSO
NTYNSYNRNGLSYIAIADASTSQQQTLTFLRTVNMSIVYCAIACGKRVLCEQSVGPIDFSSTARQYLDSSLQEYVTFAVGRVYAFLSESIPTSCHIVEGRMSTFFVNLPDLICNQSSTEIVDANFSQQDRSKVMELRGQVADVSLLMQKNIADLNERGTKLDDLFTKTEAMESDASMFRTTARQVKQKHYWDNCRTKVILFAALFVLVLIIVLIILWQTGVFNQ